MTPQSLLPPFWPCHRRNAAFLANDAADGAVLPVAHYRRQAHPGLMLPPGKPVHYAVEDDPGDPPLHAARQ